MKRLTITYIHSLVVTIALLCSMAIPATAEQLQTDKQLPLKKVSLQLPWKYQFEYAGFYAAIEQGYFADQGLEVELREYQKGINVIDEVISGRADFGVGSDNFLVARLQGKPLVLLATYFKRFPLVILAKPGLKTLADLKGKRLMIADKDLNSITFQAAFQRAGLHPSENIDIVSHSFDAAPLLAGEVDAMTAFYSNEPFFLKQAGFSHEIIELSNVLPNIGGVNFFSSEQQIQKHPAQTSAILKAVNQGWKYALDHPEEMVDLILSKYSKAKSREALLYEAEKTIELMMPDTFPIGSFFEDRIRRLAGMFANIGKNHDLARLEGMLFASDMLDRDIDALRPADAAVNLTPEEQQWLSQHPEVRIAFDGSYGPYSFQDEDGEFKGISVEILTEAAKLLNLKFTIYPNGKWKELYAAAVERKVDAVATLVRLPEREERFTFTKPYLHLKQYIITRKEDTKSFHNREQLAGKIVSMVDGYFVGRHVLDNVPEVRPFLVANAKQALEALVTGRADATVLSASLAYFLMRKHDISSLGFASLYADDLIKETIGVRKDWSELATILDKAIAAIPQSRMNAIFQKWMPISMTEKAVKPLMLTDQEQSWLCDNPVIRARIGNAPPYMIWDDGPKGISVELLDRIAEMAGFQIEYQYGTMSWPEALENIRNHEKVDLLPTAKHTPERESFMVFSQDYLKLPWVIFTRQNDSTIFGLEDLFGKTIAIEKGYVLQKRLAKEFPQIKQLLFADAAEALAAVSENQAVAYVGNLTIAQYQQFPKVYQMTQ